MNATQSMLMLKRSYELFSVGNRGEIRDSASNNKVVVSGTYRQCVAYAKRLGVWYS